MARVDPFVIQWPSKWMQDNEVRPAIEYLNRYLHDMFIRSGGGTDAIQESQKNITSSSIRVSRNAARINSLELKNFEIISITENETTDRNQIIVCKNTSPITITLDPQAVNEDEVHIKRRGEEVTVIGLIDGSSDQIINVLNWSAHYVFDGTDWSSI